jgi:hypothetical protein
MNKYQRQSSGEQNNNDQQSRDASMGETVSSASSGLAIAHEPWKEQSIIAALLDQGFSKGVASVIPHSNPYYPIRFWLIDNGGHMRVMDGKRILGSELHHQVITCSRWAELQETMDFHIQLAGLNETPTIFRFINFPPQACAREFCVGRYRRQSEVDAALSIVRDCEPRGANELSEHLREIYERICTIEPELWAQKQQAIVVLAVAGLPEDGTLADDLRLLQSLPVRLIVRLCVDDSKVYHYYADVSRGLKEPLEIVGEYFSEAKRIHKYNPWLTYGLTLHRCREMGIGHHLLSMLGQRSLDKEEASIVVGMLFGKEFLAKKASQQNNHEVNSKQFLSNVTRFNKEQGQIWNPVTGKMEFWVDTKKLQKSYSNKQFFGLIRKNSNAK